MAAFAAWPHRTAYTPAELWNGGDAAAIAFLVLSNLLIAGQDLGRFLWYDIAAGTLHLDAGRPAGLAAASGFALLGQAWTIAVELCFYAIAPWLLRLRSRALAALAAGSFLLRWLQFQLGFDSHLGWVNGFLPTVLCFFLVGVLMHRCYARHLSGPATPRAQRAAVVLLVLVCADSIAYRALGPWLGVWNEWVFYALLTAAMPALFALTRDSRFDRTLGNLAYPVYIGQYLVIGLLRQAGVTAEWIALSAAAATVAAAVGVWWGMDRPLAAWRHRRFGRGAPGVAARATPTAIAS